MPFGVGIQTIPHQETVPLMTHSWLTSQSSQWDILTMLSRRLFTFFATKGVNMGVPFKLNYTVETVQGILNFTMDVDMLAHFDEWQRSGQDYDYESHDQWPTELQRARMIPAVDYFQAQRARGKLIREIKESFKVDAFIGNATDWEKVCMGNLVGLPIIVVPTGFNNISNPPSGGSLRRTTMTTGIYAPPHRDHIALALSMAYQSATNHHKQHPPIDDLGRNDPIPNSPAVIYPPQAIASLKAAHLLLRYYSL